MKMKAASANSTFKANRSWGGRMFRPRDTAEAANCQLATAHPSFISPNQNILKLMVSTEFGFLVFALLLFF